MCEKKRKRNDNNCPITIIVMRNSQLHVVNCSKTLPYFITTAFTTKQQQNTVKTWKGHRILITTNVIIVNFVGSNLP